MKKYFSLLVLTAAVFGAGCCKKQNKATTPQTETIVKQFIQEEEIVDADKKEDYSIIA